MGTYRMLHGEELGLFAGTILLGAVHGIEPGHGWPVAASYALDRSNKWVYGIAASVILGVGHLISSIAMVVAFFYAKAYFNLTQVNEPITVTGGIQIGGPVSLVAGVLLIGLGIREYGHGHARGSRDTTSGGAHTTGEHDDHGHIHTGTDHHGQRQGDTHGHHDGSGFRSRLKAFLPFVGDHTHSHDAPNDAPDRGLVGIAWFAFVLGFAHEEEFEIIAICAGSTRCLELMSAYALTVLVGIVGLTMLLIAGYHHAEERVKRYTSQLPAFSATVLVIMGLGFIAGLF